MIYVMMILQMMFVLALELKGGGDMTKEVQEAFLEGRAPGTMVGYGTAYKKVRGAMETLGITWDNVTSVGVAKMLLRLHEDKQLAGIGQVSAVITLIGDLLEKGALMQDPVVVQIKKTLVKRTRMGKDKVKRKPLPVLLMKKLHLKYFDAKTSLKKKRFLMKASLMFYGIKRHGDIEKLRWRDVSRSEDGAIKFSMFGTKTDQLRSGQEVVLGPQLGALWEWYVGAWRGTIPADGYIFPSLRKGGTEPEWNERQSYDCFRSELRLEAEVLGFHGITPHCSRIGGATAAGKGGATRADVKETGGWKGDSGMEWMHQGLTGERGFPGSHLWERFPFELYMFEQLNVVDRERELDSLEEEELRFINTRVREEEGQDGEGLHLVFDEFRVTGYWVGMDTSISEEGEEQTWLVVGS